MASFIKTSSLQLYLKRDPDSRGISVVEIRCIAIRINFMNLLKSVGSVGSVSAWVRGFVGSWVAWVKFSQRSWVKHMILRTFVMIVWSFIVLSCDSSLFSVFSAHTVFELSTQLIFHYFIEKVLITSKNQKIKSISKILLNYLLKILLNYLIIQNNRK